MFEQRCSGYYYYCYYHYHHHYFNYYYYYRYYIIIIIIMIIIIIHSYVVGASTVGPAPTTSLFLTECLASMDWLGKDNCYTRWEIFKSGDLVCLVQYIWQYTHRYCCLLYDLLWLTILKCNFRYFCGYKTTAQSDLFPPCPTNSALDKL